MNVFIIKVYRTAQKKSRKGRTWPFGGFCVSEGKESSCHSQYNSRQQIDNPDLLAPDQIDAHAENKNGADQGKIGQGPLGNVSSEKRVVVDTEPSAEYNNGKGVMTMFFEKQIEKIYRSNIFARQDNVNGIVYFGPEDFPGLQAHPYTFKAKAGHDLKGFFYHYDNPVPGRLVVFDHGLGNGHRAYMREMECLARAGFLVFSYDHTGCMASGGPDTQGFAQSLNDLDHCLKALKAEPALAGRQIAVMGHSWGGFSTMNICALHPDITHVVSMSGFVSVEKMLEQAISGPLKFYRPGLMALERRTNPDYVDFDARRSLWHSKAKVLLIYSEDDTVVHKKVHFDRLRDALATRPNIRLLLVQGKGHNPSYTADAVAYKDAFFADFSKAVKKKQLVTPQQQAEFMARYDWRRMTAQDEAVWEQIIGHLQAE